VYAFAYGEESPVAPPTMIGLDDAVAAMCYRNTHKSLRGDIGNSLALPRQCSMNQSQAMQDPMQLLAAALSRALNPGVQPTNDALLQWKPKARHDIAAPAPVLALKDAEEAALTPDHTLGSPKEAALTPNRTISSATIQSTESSERLLMGGTGAETAGDDIEALEAKMRATSAASKHGIRKRPARAMKDLTVQPIAKRPAKAQASQQTCEGAVDFDDLIKVDGGATMQIASSHVAS
jgi:hypothetical protein